jgi:hypothetical protein
MELPLLQLDRKSLGMMKAEMLGFGNALQENTVWKGQATNFATLYKGIGN